MEELIRKMTQGLSDNIKLQIILENHKNDQVNQTGLLNKADMIAKLVDWVILFIDYHNMDIENITIKFLKMKHSEYIDNERDFYKVILNDKIKQMSLGFLNDNMVYANHKTKNEFLKVNYNANLYIAWARLRLYNMLEKLDQYVGKVT